MSDREVLSVADLTRCIRAVIEAEDLFRDLWVRGEVSNLTKHSSGHTYFSLKDQSALVRCVIWNGSSRSARFEISDGLGVIVRGRVTIYEKGGQYQLVVSEVLPDGVGTLYAAYEQLKQRLHAEGLFDVARKKPIPRFPRRIAIVTSPTAAALRDMVTIARRRMPSVDILIVPTLMQGPDSEASVVESLRLADGMSEVDVIVLGRGGGSIEDLWTFNTESVVQAIAACSTPVVSAIGHETDYTLSDLAADLRAPTPSAAMELVLQDREELVRHIEALRAAVVASMETHVERKRAALEMITGARCMGFPYEMLADRWQSLDLAHERLDRNFRAVLSRSEGRLAEAAAKLNSLSPLGVLARGYAIVRRLEDGTVVRHISQVAPTGLTETLLADGSIISEVKETRNGCEDRGTD